MPETSNVFDFINDGIKTWLVEPDKDSLKKIYEVFKNKNVVIYPFAIYDYNGKIELIQRSASTFVKDLPSSPAIVNDSYKIDENDAFEVGCKVFSDIDNGEIDLLSVDTEGCEWYILKNMKSRPKIISLETHGKFYTNPFIINIKEWISFNGYKIWYKTKSDTVYYKNHELIVSISEKIGLLVMNLHIAFRKLKRYLR
jgi:FkbM family methyltransferase